MMPAQRAQFALSFSLLHEQRLVARPPHTAPRLSPLPAASWGHAARDAAILPRAMNKRALRARLGPKLRLGTMRPALLRPAAMSKYTRGTCKSGKPLSRFSMNRALLPGRPALLHVVLACRLRHRGALQRMTLRPRRGPHRSARCALAPVLRPLRHITSRCSRTAAIPNKYRSPSQSYVHRTCGHLGWVAQKWTMSQGWRCRTFFWQTHACC